MELEILVEEPTQKTHSIPLLFVHGAWHAAWCWQENFLPYFCQHGFRPYAFSLRGHGQSEGDVQAARLHDYVDDLAVIVDQLPTRPIIIAHSMGGLITQQYLETHHDSPAAILLAPVPHTGVSLMMLRVAVQTPGAFLKSLAKQSSYEFLKTPALARKRFFSENMAEEQVIAYHRQLQDESFVVGREQISSSLVQPELIETKILILGADRDRLFSRREIEATAKAYHTQAEFFSMAHDMMLEAGWQQVADRIIEWLREQGF